MQPSAAAQPDEAAQTLESVRAAREAAERRLAPNWFPLVVAGLLLFASSFVFDVGDGAAVAAFWLAAAPLAFVAVKLQQRLELRLSGGFAMTAHTCSSRGASSLPASCSARSAARPASRSW